jgi:hypothetical protein
MPRIDDYELEVITAYDKGRLKSVATEPAPGPARKRRATSGS